MPPYVWKELQSAQNLSEWIAPNQVALIWFYTDVCPTSIQVRPRLLELLPGAGSDEDLKRVPVTVGDEDLQRPSPYVFIRVNCQNPNLHGWLKNQVRVQQVPTMAFARINPTSSSVDAAAVIQYKRFLVPHAWMLLPLAEARQSLEQMLQKVDWTQVDDCARTPFPQPRPRNLAADAAVSAHPKLTHFPQPLPTTTDKAPGAQGAPGTPSAADTPGDANTTGAAGAAAAPGMDWAAIGTLAGTTAAQLWIQNQNQQSQTSPAPPSQAPHAESTAPIVVPEEPPLTWNQSILFVIVLLVMIISFGWLIANLWNFVFSRLCVSSSSSGSQLARMNWVTGIAVFVLCTVLFKH